MCFRDDGKDNLREPAAIRKQLRAQRRSLSDRAQTDASLALTKIIACQLFFMKARRVAFYLPADGEISPIPLCRLSARLGKACYLPVISNDNTILTFDLYAPDVTVLKKNRYGIPEPQTHQPIPARMLDIVFMPLVAFDREGNRLGMGKGYYDHTFKNVDRWWRKPRLIGLAHSLQETHLEPKEWDIPMHSVATESFFV